MDHNQSQLEGKNELDPIKVEYTQIQKFIRNHVCSICRHHPHAKPTDDRNIYEIHCLVCGVPIIEGGYISVYNLEKLELAEWEVKTEIRQPKNDPNFDEDVALKELGF